MALTLSDALHQFAFVAIPTLTHSYTLVALEKKRGLHFQHSHKLHNVLDQCFVFQIKKQRRNVLVVLPSFEFYYLRDALSYKEGFFFILCKSDWKERNARGKKHFSNAIFPWSERDRTRMKTGRVFFFHTPEKMENKKSLICGNERS